MTNQEPEAISTELVVESQWLRLERVKFKTAQGETRLWDRCTRTSPEHRENMRQAKSSYRLGHILEEQSVSKTNEGLQPVNVPDIQSASSIIALTYKSSYGHSTEKFLDRKDAGIILVKQFRPPIGAKTIELPAGLVDPGESCETAALRELKEETGYTAERIIHSSPGLCLSPGASNEGTTVIIALVDLDDERNRSSQQELEAEEDIEVLLVPIKALRETLEREQKAGHVVFDGVYLMMTALSILPTII